MAISYLCTRRVGSRHLETFSRLPSTVHVAIPFFPDARRPSALNKLRDFLPCFAPTPSSEYCVSFSGINGANYGSAADTDFPYFPLNDACDGDGNIGDGRALVCGNRLLIENENEREVSLESGSGKKVEKTFGTRKLSIFKCVRVSVVSLRSRGK